MALEKKIFKFRQCIFASLLFSHIGKARALYLNKLETYSPKDALCKVLLELAQ